MKGLALAAMLATLAGAALADPVEGLWKTQPDDNGNYGNVRFYPCEARICGQLVAAFDASGRPVPSPDVGKRIVWDMQPTGHGDYGKGKIYAPDRKKTYSSKMALAGNRLSVAGCVLGICRSQIWTRTD